ncbi:phospholipase D-like domain-containing protein DpdK [Micromonospora echinofusca]|uniref:phospholipase D-like domain-containing protein DpdK n=1 Tax=Micromonospora echinofusca TaxID=47858 RepID=UPI00371152C6
MSHPSRTLRRGHTRTTEDLEALLQAVFIGELLAPSEEIWIVSPWISDIGVVDNTDGAFTGLEPSWGARHVRLSEMLLRLAARGTRVFVEVRPDEHNARFLQRLQQNETANRVQVRRSPVLHEKGLLGDAYLLNGSMNFTYNGVQLLDEWVRFDTDPRAIAEARLAFRARWGHV